MSDLAALIELASQKQRTTREQIAADPPLAVACMLATGVAAVAHRVIGTRWELGFVLGAVV